MTKTAIPDKEDARASSAASEEDGRLTIGTLRYTKAGLLVLFLYLLWGDFCFTLMETVVPSILPLKFNSIGAPNWAVGLAVVTIPNALSMAINPWFSFKSDRFRSKWGRRIPFLAGATPLLVFSLILLGFVEPLGQWVSAKVAGGTVSETTVIMLLMTFFMISFSFFNIFVSTSYYCLFNDVVPRAYLTRFMSLFRMVGLGANAAYNFFLLQYANSHMREIFVGSGLLYLITFAVVCWKVREGSYPPPPPNVDHQTGALSSIRTYLRECFTHRFYWFLFLSSACVAMTWVTGTYSLLYQTKYLGVDIGFVGKVSAASGILGILLLYPAASLADRIHPLRVLLLAAILQTGIGTLSIAYAMTRPLMSIETVTTIFLIMTVLWLPVTALYGAAELPAFMRLFPLDRYAQFGSANALIRSLGLIVGGVTCGAFLDFAKKFHPVPEYAFRFLPVWTFVFQAGIAVFLLLVYREWKRLGMRDNIAPESLARHHSL